MDIVITLATLGGLIIGFAVMNWLVSLGMKALTATWLRHHPQKAANVRQNITVVLLIACVALCLGVAGVNGVLIYQGKNVSTFYLNVLGSIPRQFWSQLAIALFKCISLLLLVKLSLPYLRQLLDRGCVLAQNSDHITANDESVRAFFTTLKKVLSNGAWLLAIMALPA